MRATAFETILPNAPITALPLNLAQSASRVSPLLMLALALPATLAALTPFWLIARHADPAILVGRLETSIPLAAAFLLWGGLFGWPIAIKAWRIGQRRTISIAHGLVEVEDATVLGIDRWSEPLSAYDGIAHHVRASLSGTRHELLLVHPDPRRSLLLRAAPAINQRETDELTGLLGCREIAPQVFYRRPDREPGTFAGARSGLATAR